MHATKHRLMNGVNAQHAGRRSKYCDITGGHMEHQCGDEGTDKCYRLHADIQGNLSCTNEKRSNSTQKRWWCKIKKKWEEKQKLPLLTLGLWIL